MKYSKLCVSLAVGASVCLVALMALGRRNVHVSSPDSKLASGPGLSPASAAIESHDDGKAVRATRKSLSARQAAEGQPAALGRVAADQKPPSQSETAQSAMPPVFRQSLDTLTSPQTSYAERQAAWKQLRDAGQLDPAIASLEQGTSANPQSPEFPAALGQAYLQKAGSIQDLREQGILGMKADQTLEAALRLDPSNWDARFWKTTAMSYWPAMLGKSQEVVDEYLALISQQESQSPEAHFAQTYDRLGGYYQKLGHDEYAQQVWKRGAALYPQDSELRGRLEGAK